MNSNLNPLETNDGPAQIERSSFESTEVTVMRTPLGSWNRWEKICFSYGDLDLKLAWASNLNIEDKGLQLQHKGLYTNFKSNPPPKSNINIVFSAASWAKWIRGWKFDGLLITANSVDSKDGLIICNLSELAVGFKGFLTWKFTAKAQIRIMAFWIQKRSQNVLKWGLVVIALDQGYIGKTKALFLSPTPIFPVHVPAHHCGSPRAPS